MDDSFDPETKCLELAEKIIGCLNDGAILERFQEIKRNIFSQSQPNRDVESHLKAMVLENRELTKKLEDLKARNESQMTLTEYSLSVLNDHIQKTAPNPQSQITNIDDATAYLLDIIDAREKASTLKRQQFTDENAQLRDKISKTEAVGNEEIKQYRQRRLENDHIRKQTQKQLKLKISKIRSKVEQLSIKLDDINEENSNIEQSMQEKSSTAEKLSSQLKNAEARKESELKEIDRLRDQLQKYQNLVRTKDREVNTKRATQRFGIGETDEADLETIRQLEEEISLLYQHNQGLSIELKKKKLASAFIDFSDSSRI